jgi:Cys-rich protein (TIGR01571 family)
VELRGPLGTGASVKDRLSTSIFTTGKDKMGTISTSIFTTGNTSLCLLSYLCPCYANALIKEAIKPNSCTFLNMMCCVVNPVVVRTMFREKFNLQGSEFEDCCIVSALPCCSINQMLQALHKR